MRLHSFSLESPASHHVTGDPRDLWPRERDFRDWLMASPGMLAACLGMPGIEYTGREAVTGDQAADFDCLGRQRWNGGLRADLTARDAHGRVIVIEAQLGAANHDHLGKLVSYATALPADVAVWAVAALEPPFLQEHLDVLAELNEAYAGRRRFTAVTVTLQSNPGPAFPSPCEPLLPRMRRADLPSPDCGKGMPASVRSGRTRATMSTPV
jgi:hypothetical protein